MVLAGQFLERSVTVRSGELVLDALYHRGTRAPPCLLLSPHPALGGSMTVPVIAELAWALTRAGHATLRFDYRGVGASQGASRHHAGSLVRDEGPPLAAGALLGPGELQDEVDDLLAGLEQLRTTAQAGDLCAVGYSFGAAVALAAAQDARIGRLVLVAPPTALADFSALRLVQKPVLLVCAQHDPLCDRAALALPEAARVEVIPNADHSFRRGLGELGRLVATWLRGDRPELVVPAGDAGDEPEALRELDLDPGASDEPPLELEVSASEDEPVRD